MNLVDRGSHAAADWLLGILARTTEPVQVSVMPEGLLRTRPEKRPSRFGTPIGTFKRGVRYSTVVEQLAWVRARLVNGQAL